MLLSSSLSFVLPFLLVSFALVRATGPLLKTNIGAFEGKRLEFGDAGSVDAFYGVPFARPPLSELRFEKPVEAEFAPKRAAVAAKPACPQPRAPGFSLQEESEDCLFLDVFKPAAPSADGRGRPLLVFVHGGGFQGGSAHHHSTEFFAKTIATNGAVLISLQYRLGVLGFASTGEEAFAGNYGLWDLRAALLWIRKNAAALDVDPARITVGGYSAGSAAVGMLTISEETRDLFQQAIQMSGSPFAEWATSEKSIELTTRVAAHLRCGVLQSAKEVKDCLKTKSVDELLAAFEAAFVRERVAPPAIFGEKAAEVQSELLDFYVNSSQRPKDRLFYLEQYAKVQFVGCWNDGGPPNATLSKYGVLFNTRFNPLNDTADDLRFQKNLLDAIVNFVKNGTPKSAESPQFEAVSAKKPLVYSEISTEIQLRNGLFERELRFYDRLTDDFDFDLIRGVPKTTRRSRTEL
ncbi:Carboxylic ester hydrolase [Aphelenchoides fujianensis]|nr:Carboxylic ester hydrolase [Aphelenchoides fujianensis]